MYCQPALGQAKLCVIGVSCVSTLALSVWSVLLEFDPIVSKTMQNHFTGHHFQVCPAEGQLAQTSQVSCLRILHLSSSQLCHLA